jgi:hypothetical protein
MHQEYMEIPGWLSRSQLNQGVYALYLLELLTVKLLWIGWIIADCNVDGRIVHRETSALCIYPMVLMYPGNFTHSINNITSMWGQVFIEFAIDCSLLSHYSISVE